MEKKQFKIANIFVIMYPCSIINKYWKKFENESPSRNGITLSVQSIFCDKIEVSGDFRMYSNIEKRDRILCKSEDIAIVNESWTSMQIFPLVCMENKFSFIKEMFCIHTIQRHMIQLHSSLIEHEGRGLMFLGPSGIGKTTQAELWNKYRDALIINGDIVFVQETEDGFLGWGTPWHGSSPYCENTSVPVKALVVLKQAPENSIRELTGFEKVTAVSNSVFYPQWLENGMELCLETLDHLLSALPVYELSCRPDEEAVQLTEEAVFGRG